MTKYMAVLASVFAGCVAGKMIECPQCGVLPALVVIIGACLGFASQMEKEA